MGGANSCDNKKVKCGLLHNSCCCSSTLDSFIKMYNGRKNSNKLFLNKVVYE